MKSLCGKSSRPIAQLPVLRERANKVLPSASGDRWDKKACECFVSSLPRFLLLDWERWLSGCSLGIRLWGPGLEEVGWQEVSPLSPSPHTHHVCGKLGCSSAPSVGYFNRSMWHFRCVLLLFMALVNKVTSVKSPMHTRPSSREEEEEMGLNILVAVVYWVGSAILLKNTNRLHWDVITAGGLHTRYYTL